VANLFLLPTVLLLIAINVFPLFWSLYLSFCRYNDLSPDAAKWIGGANYTSLLANPDNWHNFIFTARFTLLAVGLQLLVGFGLALLLNRTFKAKGIVTTLILLPMMLSPVVVGKFWNYMFQTSQGLVNWLLQTAHLQSAAHPINWLNDPVNAMWTLVIVDTWMWSPFVMLISLAGLNAVPPHLYEAAEVDRASTWFKFRYITLPMVSPLVMIALLFRTMDCFKLFDLCFALTGGAPGTTTQTVSYNLYKRAFDTHQTGYACALAYIILLIIIGLANLFILYLAKVRGEGKPDAESLSQVVAERTRDIPVIGWLFQTPVRPIVLLVALFYARQLPALATWLGAYWFLFVGAAVLAAAAWGVTYLPTPVRNLLAYAVIGVVLVLYLLPIYWIGVTSITPTTQVSAIPPKLLPTHLGKPGEPSPPGITFGATLQNYDTLLYQREGNEPTGKIEGYSTFIGQLGNSLFVGILSTFLAVALGTMAAYAFARFRIKGKADLLFFILSTRMLPAIAVVIPIFLLFSTLHLLGTRTGLVILYTVFNLSFSTYLLKGFFDDIPHEYDDAALLDGYSRLRTFWKISLPQALTGIAATAVFCFITAWNEFAFAQVLSTTDPLTAPPSIVSRTGYGGTDWGQIAAGAMVFLIPVALFTFAMRKHLLRGVTFGAIKK
jgi:multiple sugar transport system permease protein